MYQNKYSIQRISVITRYYFFKAFKKRNCIGAHQQHFPDLKKFVKNDTKCEKTSKRQSLPHKGLLEFTSETSSSCNRHKTGKALPQSQTS